MTRFLGNGRYALGKQLGVGGMGTVYDGADLALTDRVAIKVARDDHLEADVITKYMAHELRAGRAIRHPNVVAILDGGCEAGSAFLVMKRARGVGLGALCALERLWCGGLPRSSIRSSRVWRRFTTRASRTAM